MNHFDINKEILSITSQIAQLEASASDEKLELLSVQELCIMLVKCENHSSFKTVTDRINYHAKTALNKNENILAAFIASKILTDAEISENVKASKLDNSNANLKEALVLIDLTPHTTAIMQYPNFWTIGNMRTLYSNAAGEYQGVIGDYAKNNYAPITNDTNALMFKLVIHSLMRYIIETGAMYTVAPQAFEQHLINEFETINQQCGGNLNAN